MQKDLTHRALAPSLAASIQQAVARHKMFRAGDSVGVAVSGGADSVALLRLLDDLRGELGIRLFVLHFNHQLRGAESDGDEQFVAELAAQLGIEFVAGREDVAAEAHRRRWNLEDAARRLRYAFFAGVVEAGRMARVAVAHTADDQAETVLARLARGTGPAGLAAIYPVKDPIVRPLLDVRRAELRQYLERQAQSWREDASNRDVTRLRARLRYETLPALERQTPAIVAHLGRLAWMAREDEVFWSALVAERLGALLRRDVADNSSTVLRGNGNRSSLGIRCADLLMPWPAFGTGPGAAPGIASGIAPPIEAQLPLARRLVRGIVEKLRGDCRQLTAQHVEQVLRLAASGSSGHRTQLPGMVVERSFDCLWFGLSSAPIRAGEAREAAGASLGPPWMAKRERTMDFSHPVEIGFAGDLTVVVISEINRRFRLKVVDGPLLERETTVLDRDLLRSPLVLRNWRPGDAFRPQGRRSVHKLKQLLRTSRVSVRDRRGWPVLTSAGALVWSRGMPVAAEFAAGQSTQMGVLIVEEEI